MSSPQGDAAVLGNRFAVITDDDHTGILWVVSILCLTYTIMIFLLRLEARRKNLGFDDALASIGTLFAAVQYILIFFANQHGLGRSYTLTSNEDADKISKYLYASQIMLLLALGCAKCSVISLCRRLFSSHMQSHRVLCDIAMGLCITWSVASIMAITIQCSPLQVLGYQTPFCYNLTIRWTAVAILDCVTEVAIVAMAWNGLWPLQMSMSRKMHAIATFLLRLITVVFAALHLTTLRDTTTASNIGVAYTIPTIYLQVELLYALLSASIPALNRWLRNFDTSVGSAWLANASQTSGNNSKTGGSGRHNSRSYQLQSMDSQAGERKRMSKTFAMPKRSSPGLKTADFVPPGPKYSVSTEVFPHSRGSDAVERPTSTGMNSDDMIIRKDVHWHVQYEAEGSIHQESR